MDGLLFRVVEGKKEYRIYTNGKIEGFADGAIAINYFDVLVATAIQKHARHRPTNEDHECPTTERQAQRTAQP